jgi:hypothetical protein
VIFLDADDMLLPDTVARVVAAFQSKPGVAKAQYRMRILDASGKLTGEVKPPAKVPLPSGDMRPRLMERGYYIWPSTSGNAFASAVLRWIMPIPENAYRGMPDIYLCNVSAVFGEVISLEEPGVLYRVHGGNNYFRPADSVDLDVLRKELLANDDAFIRKKHFFSALYSVDPHTVVTGYQNMYHLCWRMISLKLDRQNHPFNETLWMLFVQGCVLCVTVPISRMPWSMRMFYLLWFAAMLLSPKPLGWPLARVLGVEKKKWLRNKLFLVRKGG